MSELNDLHERLGEVIKNTCNKIGCKNCGLKWDGGCSATELQGQIMDIEVSSDEKEAN
jgi:hypothetical protein